MDAVWGSDEEAQDQQVFTQNRPFIDGDARMSTDEPFVGACDPEHCNDYGERFIAAMKVDEMIAANTWYLCGYTWRSAKGHTSRSDFVPYDASRVEEIQTCGIGHPVDLACGASEDHRYVKVFNRGQR